jgi:uncharacterized protein (DUF1501 family)
MAITRRQFLRRTGMAAAGSFLAPGFLRNPFLQRALADTIGDRYFVVLFLDGGNDGLNTITPYDNGSIGTLRTHYETARKPTSTAGGLRLAPAELLIPAAGPAFVNASTGTQLGFHPGLGGFRNLYELGKLAVIQGCGYPDYNLSHEVSSTIWETANISGTTSGLGWMGRYLAANYGPTDIKAVCIRDAVAGEFAQTATSVLAIQRLQYFGFPYDEYDASDTVLKRSAFEALCNAASAGSQPVVQYLGNSGSSTLLATESHPPLHGLYTTDRPSWNSQYSALNTGTARNLREIAKVIYGVDNGVPNVSARFFELSNGGYDTHSDQGAGGATTQHYQLLSEVGDALALFYQDIDDMGVADKVCVMVWSEFSRRVPQNDNGTDHGSQGPMFVIGGLVNGGVYGNHPNIDPAAIDDNGNTVYTQSAGLYRSTDFRDVYGTLLTKWLGMPQAQVLSDILPPDPGPGEYWTTPDFNLGFI